MQSRVLHTKNNGKTDVRHIGVFLGQEESEALNRHYSSQPPLRVECKYFTHAIAKVGFPQFESEQECASNKAKVDVFK